MLPSLRSTDLVLAKCAYQNGSIQVPAYRDEDGAVLFTAGNITQAVGRSYSSFTGRSRKRAFDPDTRESITLFQEGEALAYWALQAKKGNAKAAILLDELGQLPKGVQLPSDASEFILAHKTGSTLVCYRLPEINFLFFSAKQICDPVSMTASSFNYWLKDELLENGSYALVCPVVMAKPVKVYSANITLAYWQSVVVKYSTTWSQATETVRYAEQATQAINLLHAADSETIDQTLQNHYPIYDDILPLRAVIYPLRPTKRLSAKDPTSIPPTQIHELHINDQALQQQLTDQAKRIRDLDGHLEWAIAQISDLNQSLRDVREQMHFARSFAQFSTQVALTALKPSPDHLEVLAADLDQLTEILKEGIGGDPIAGCSVSSLSEQIAAQLLCHVNAILQRKRDDLELIVEPNGTLYLKAKLPRREAQDQSTTQKISLRRKLSLFSLTFAVGLLIRLNPKLERHDLLWDDLIEGIEL